MVDLNLNLMQAELNGAGKIRMSSLSPRGDLFKKGCIRWDNFFLGTIQMVAHFVRPSFCTTVRYNVCSLVLIDMCVVMI